MLYAAALVAYVWHFARRDPAVGRSATTILVAGALTHTFVIGMRTMEGGQVPVAGASAAISTFVWLLAIAYIYTEMTTDERAMGVFILPLLVALEALAAFTPSPDVRSAVLQGPLFGLHVSSLLFAYASFALAFVIGITYVLLFKEIKAKHLGFFYARLPSLQVLDRMNQRAIVIGWFFLTVGLVAGVVYAAAARAAPAGADDPRRAGDGPAGPEDLRRAGLLGGLLVRAVRCTTHRLGRATNGVSVGPRIFDRAAELRADHVLPDEEP